MRVAVIVAGIVTLMSGLLVPSLAADQAAAGRKVNITFDLEGRVTLVAEHATVREILAEWGRVGGSYIINGEKLTGTPIPLLRFENRPEAEVIDSLLRTAAGYILGPRTVRTSGPSAYEAVMILPTSTPIGSAVASVPSSSPLRTPGAVEDEIAPVTPVNVPVTNAPPEMPPPAPGRANAPGPGVFVPIVPITPVNTGRGRGGGL
ncbi:MAG TPA: hypothetical protein VMM93_03735 [Vicinamibacterales bacterium]|nr:hypothetical protein [Vicinamibacterales bacterium]